MLSPLIGEGSVGGGTRSLLRWKDLLKRYVLSLEWRREGLMDAESGDDDKDAVG